MTVFLFPTSTPTASLELTAGSIIDKVRINDAINTVQIDGLYISTTNKVFVDSFRLGA